MPEVVAEDFVEETVVGGDSDWGPDERLEVESMVDTVPEEISSTPT